MIKQETYEGIAYLIRFPDDFDACRKYPVIFHTHGAGCRGNDTSVLKTVGAMKEAVNGNACLKDCIVVSPQCSANTWFDVFERLVSLCKYVYSLEYVDKTRFYASGISMGGYAIVQLMMSCPELFAAGIVCCGGGMYWNAGRLKKIPLRFFHGAQDTAVYPEESLHLCAKICAHGGDASVKIYPNNAHNCWDDVYSDATVYEWLFRKRKEEL